jgi:hypothetical protein
LPEIAEIVRRKAEATSIVEDSGSMIQNPIMVPLAAPDTVSLGQGQQAEQAGTPLIYKESVPTAVLHPWPSLIEEGIYQTPVSPVQRYSQKGQQAEHTEMPLIYRESIPTAGLRPQPSLIEEGIYQMPVSPVQRYFKKPAEDAVPPDRSEGFGFLLNQEHEPSSLGYGDTHQRVLEMPPYFIAEPKIYPKAGGDEESLVSTFATASYYGSQPEPEMALAPVGRLAEEVSQIQLSPAEEAEETEEEEEPFDIDDLAREVYSKLRWRLKTDRERERGLS